MTPQVGVAGGPVVGKGKSPRSSDSTPRRELFSGGGSGTALVPLRAQRGSATSAASSFGSMGVADDCGAGPAVAMDAMEISTNPTIHTETVEDDWEGTDGEGTYPSGVAGVTAGPSRGQMPAPGGGAGKSLAPPSAPLLFSCRECGKEESARWDFAHKGAGRCADCEDALLPPDVRVLSVDPSRYSRSPIPRTPSIPHPWGPPHGGAVDVNVGLDDNAVSMMADDEFVDAFRLGASLSPDAMTVDEGWQLSGTIDITPPSTRKTVR